MKSMGYGPDEAIARVQFREGVALFREKRYAEAAPSFYTASWRWPDSTLEENALFLQGESYYFDNQYGKAEDAYDLLLKAHGNTRYIDTVIWRLFAMARYWEQFDDYQPHWEITPNFNDKTRPWFGTWSNAIGAHETIHLHDPRGPLADTAVLNAANMYLRRSIRRRRLPLRHHPQGLSQEQVSAQAHPAGLESKMAMYQGPLYDVQPLKDAAEIADQTLKQFRGRLGAEEAHVLQVRCADRGPQGPAGMAHGAVLRQQEVLRGGTAVLQVPRGQLSADPLCRPGPHAFGADSQRARLAPQPFQVVDRGVRSREVTP